MRAIRGKVLVKIDTKQKEKLAFNGGTLIIERGYNFNRREDYPSMGGVIDGEGLPAGAEILLHHNVSEAAYNVEGETLLTDEERAEGYRVFSVPADMCFCYKVEGGEWTPCKHFLLTKRIFKPYEGLMTGIEPAQVKNRMYVTKGIDTWDDEVTDISGRVMVVTENSDYQIIWHDKEHKEQTIIRTRHRELLAFDEGMQNDIEKGKYLVGVTLKDAKKINTEDGVIAGKN